jgi:uncharacterized protein (TIGR03905 family)
MRTYKTAGTCSTSIDFEVENGVITYCKINDGCAGNTVAVSKLVVGGKVSDVIKMLKGIPCQEEGSSCPDQLARALEQYIGG